MENANAKDPVVTLNAAGAGPAKAKTVVYWAATIVAAFAFLLPGVGNLVRAPSIARDMAHLGYPPYFLAVLGTWKVLGAVVIGAPGLPRLKEWAYAGMIFDLTGAAVSRAVMGDGAAMVIVPLAIASVVLLSSALRPEDRRLDSAKERA
jgi:hypothetical protein